MLARLVAVCMLVVIAAPARAQPQDAAAALKKALEGRHVTVLMDMPATSAGVDLYPQREPDIQAEAVGLRLKNFGAAIRRGARVPITLIKVNKKNIEVQLAGGGYGVAGDPVAIPMPAYVPKSRQELDLERERDRTRDATRKKEIERELRALADERSRAQIAASRLADLEYAVKAAEIARKRLERGSRFNVWYPDKRLEQWVPTTADLMQALSQYVDFSDPRLSSLRRGMKTSEVYDLLGFPTRRRPSREGDFAASVETWETRGDLVEVTFVDGLVVNIVSAPK